MSLSKDHKNTVKYQRLVEGTKKLGSEYRTKGGERKGREKGKKPIKIFPLQGGGQKRIRIGLLRGQGKGGVKRQRGNPENIVRERRGAVKRGEIAS